MAHLYHSTCYDSRWRKFIRWLKGERGMPRFIYDGGPGTAPVPTVEADAIMQTQTFRCNSCGDTIHVDTDWVDEAGGFIGKAITVNEYSSRGGRSVK